MKTKKVPEVKVKKAKTIDEFCNYVEKGIDAEYCSQTNPIWNKEWKENKLPDSQNTVEQVKDWSRFKPQREINETPINYWKYACIFILLGAVTGMILSTPIFVKLAEVCTQ